MEEHTPTNHTDALRIPHPLSATDPETSLTTALEQLTARYETELALRNQPLHTQLRWEGERPATELPEPVTSAVLRAVQVGLGNVAAHAHATQAVKKVDISQQELSVAINHDGDGFY